MLVGRLIVAEVAVEDHLLMDSIPVSLEGFGPGKKCATIWTFVLGGQMLGSDMKFESTLIGE